MNKTNLEKPQEPIDLLTGDYHESPMQLQQITKNEEEQKEFINFLTGDSYANSIQSQQVVKKCEKHQELLTEDRDKIDHQLLEEKISEVSKNLSYIETWQFFESLCSTPSYREL